MTDTHPDVDVLRAHEFDIACDVAEHVAGLFGHAGPATHWVATPCDRGGFTCSGAVDVMLAAGGIRCSCGTKHYLPELRVTPIAGVR